MRSESPVMDADTARGHALTHAKGPWDQAATAGHSAAEPVQGRARQADHANAAAPAFAALIPATLFGFLAFLGGLVTGQGLDTSLLAYTLVGSATYAILIALVLLRSNGATWHAPPAAPEPAPEEMRRMAPQHARTSTSRRRPHPATWQEDCVARPVGSIHDQR